MQQSFGFAKRGPDAIQFGYCTLIDERASLLLRTLATNNAGVHWPAAGRHQEPFALLGRNVDAFRPSTPVHRATPENLLQIDCLGKLSMHDQISPFLLKGHSSAAVHFPGRLPGYKPQRHSQAGVSHGFPERTLIVPA
jgi:hypothetical protein